MSSMFAMPQSSSASFGSGFPWTGPTFQPQQTSMPRGYGAPQSYAQPPMMMPSYMPMQMPMMMPSSLYGGFSPYAGASAFAGGGFAGAGAFAGGFGMPFMGYNPYASASAFAGGGFGLPYMGYSPFSGASAFGGVSNFNNMMLPGLLGNSFTNTTRLTNNNNVLGINNLLQALLLPSSAPVANNNSSLSLLNLLLGGAGASASATAGNGLASANASAISTSSLLNALLGANTTNTSNNSNSLLNALLGTLRPTATAGATATAGNGTATATASASSNSNLLSALLGGGGTNSNNSLLALLLSQLLNNNNNTIVRPTTPTTTAPTTTTTPTTTVVTPPTTTTTTTPTTTTTVQGPTNVAWGDPHFVYTHNGKKLQFDFQGQAGKTFNLFKDGTINVNSKFKAWKGHNGATVMENFGFNLNGKKLFFEKGNATLDGVALKKDEVVTFDTGIAVPNKPGETYKGTIKFTGKDLEVNTGEYFFKALDRGEYMDLHVQGTNIGIRANGLDPTGVQGETVDIDHKNYGKGGRTGPNAQGEGYLNYKMADYLVDDLWDTQHVYKEDQHAVQLGVAKGQAATGTK